MAEVPPLAATKAEPRRVTPKCPDLDAVALRQRRLPPKLPTSVRTTPVWRPQSGFLNGSLGYAEPSVSGSFNGAEMT